MIIVITVAGVYHQVFQWLTLNSQMEHKGTLCLIQVENSQLNYKETLSEN